MTVDVNNSTDELLPAEHKPAVGEVTARGLVWMFGQSVASKVITTVSQILLGWLLVPQDFGRIGLAFTVYAFPALLQQHGLRDVLTQRQRRFTRLSNAGFWMGLASGTLAGVLMIAAAPVAQAWYHADIFHLVLLLAISAPIESLSTTPYAKLQVEMRFRTIAVMYLWNIFANAALSILFAWYGMGPYSVILPKPILAGVQAIVLLYLTRPKTKWNPELRLWKQLLGPLGMLVAVSLCNTLVSQADYISLGLFRSEEVVGIYFFAFGIALQTLRLVAGSVSSVMFPALSRLKDNAEHQVQVAIKTIRVMACVAVPALLLQATCARPVLDILFHHKWDAAVPVVQILSLGLALDAMSWVGGSLLQAQGRFKDYLLLNIAAAVVFLVVVLLGGYLFAAVGVAVVVAIYYLALSPVFMSVTLRPSGVPWRTIMSLYTRPLIIGIVSIGIAALAGQLVWGQSLTADGLRLAVILVVAALAYFPLLRMLAPDVWDELIARGAQVFRRNTRGFPVGRP